MSVVLVLTTETGDLVGRLPLPSVTVSADESTAILNTDRSEQLGTLYQVIAEHLATEEFEVALDTVAYHVEVSRCLLGHTGEDDLTITLPVRQTGTVESPGGSAQNGTDVDLDDLFLVMEPDGGEEVSYGITAEDA